MEKQLQVVLAKTAGFCFGVKRAVETVYDQIASSGTAVYTYGPIIHNTEVVNDLKKKGVKVIENQNELKKIQNGIVVIRSHGISRDIYRMMEEHGLKIVDATCPFVKKIHKIVEEQCREGLRVVIIGNPDHPEVIGIRGWGDERTIVVDSLEKFYENVPDITEKICIVAQTTYNYNKFKDLVEKISKRGYDILVLNTICNATQERQVEARHIASEVDAMIVIGDRNSSNTQKLYEICSHQCKDTYFIQTLSDLNPEELNSVRSVGITAGASTPDYIIEEVQSNVRIKF